MLRVQKSGSYVRSSPDRTEVPHTWYTIRDNTLHKCAAGEVLMYLGECHPRNYYKVLCTKGPGWIYWSDVEVVDGDHELDGLPRLSEDVDERY